MDAMRQTWQTLDIIAGLCFIAFGTLSYRLFRAARAAWLDDNER